MTHRDFTLTVCVDDVSSKAVYGIVLTDEASLTDSLYLKDIELVGKSLSCLMYCTYPWTIEVGWNDVLNCLSITLKEHDIKKHVLYINPTSKQVEVGAIDLNGKSDVVPTKTHVTTEVIYEIEE